MNAPRTYKKEDIVIDGWKTLRSGLGEAYLSAPRRLWTQGVEDMSSSSFAVSVSAGNHGLPSQTITRDSGEVSPMEHPFAPLFWNCLGKS